MKDESMEFFKKDLYELCENYGVKIKDIVQMINNDERQEKNYETGWRRTAILLAKHIERRLNRIMECFLRCTGIIR